MAIAFLYLNGKFALKNSENSRLSFVHYLPNFLNSQTEHHIVCPHRGTNKKILSSGLSPAYFFLSPYRETIVINRHRQRSYWSETYPVRGVSWSVRR